MWERDSKNSWEHIPERRTDTHERERVHGDMDLRQYAFTGHAEGYRIDRPEHQGLPDKSRPFQTDNLKHIRTDTG